MDATRGHGGTILFLTIEGLPAVEESVEAWEKGLARVGESHGEIMANLVQQFVAAEAPNGLTGQLGSTLYHLVQPGENWFNIEIVSPQFYAYWVINGRGWVYPVKAKWLHWITKNGEDVFAKQARPSAPNDFPGRGWERAQSHVEQIWGDAIEEIVQR